MSRESKAFNVVKSAVKTLAPLVLDQGAKAGVSYLFKKGRRNPKPGYSRPIGPLLPGGEFDERKIRTARSAAFLRNRQQGRSQPARGSSRRGKMRMVQGSGMDAPVNFSNSVCTLESDFRSVPIRTGTHGPGANVAFSAAIATIGSNGVATVGQAGDFQNAIGFALSGNNSLIPSGFITADGNWSSGILLHPVCFGPRMLRETQNWTEWRPRDLTFSYQNQVATSVGGSFTFSATRDPDDFIEAIGTQAAPTHSYTALSQNIPNCAANTYKDLTLKLNRWDPAKYYPTEIANGTPYVPSQSVATLAYNSTHYCGRFVAMYTGPVQVLNPSGMLWVHGFIDFFGPSAGAFSIGTTTTALTLERPIIYHRNKWNTYRMFLALKREYDRKVDTKIRVLNSPAPTLPHLSDEDGDIVMTEAEQPWPEEKQLVKPKSRSNKSLRSD